MLVKELKSYILKQTGNKPFTFMFIIENDRKVSELIEIQNNRFGSNTIDVLTDFEHFDLNLEYTSSLTQVKTK